MYICSSVFIISYLDVSERPTMKELRHLEVPRKICYEYITLASLLLRDDVLWDFMRIGSRPKPPEAKSSELLSLWLQGDGLPVTWKTLIRALRDSDLYSLADEIATIKVHILLIYL